MNKLQFFSIKARLVTGMLVATLLCTVTASYFYIESQQITRFGLTTSHKFNQQLDKLQRVEIELDHLNNLMTSAFTTSKKSIEQVEIALIQTSKLLTQTIADLLATEDDQPGGKKLKSDLEELIQFWPEIQTILQKIVPGQPQDSVFRFHHAFVAKLNAIQQTAKLLYAQKKALSAQLKPQIEEAFSRFHTRIIGISLLVLLFLAACAILIIRSIKVSINHLQIPLTNLVKSGTMIPVVLQGNNEITRVAKDFNFLISKLIDQNWVQGGANLLHSNLSGKTDFASISQTIISFISPYIQAISGGLYFYNKDARQLECVATYASRNDEFTTQVIPMGSGVIGQSALDKRPFKLNNLPPQSIIVTNGTTAISPQGMYVLPLLWENELCGVISFSFLTEATPLIETFLTSSSAIIASHLMHAKQNEKIEDLLNFLQKQNTELEKANLHTEQKADKMEKASKYKTKFLANMSHEIRTPLNAIMGFSQILGREAQKLQLPPTFLSHLQNIERGGVSLLGIINNILDFSKIEAGKMQLTMEDILFKQLITNVYHMIRMSAEQKGVILNYEIDANLPEVIHSDRTKLNQIVTNLLSNAIKFTPAGKAITIRAERQESWIRILCIDEGIGIPADKIDAIFEPFEQGSIEPNQESSGTGLGLTITRTTINLLKGKIDVKSVHEVGTTFTVCIPLIEAAQQTRQKNAMAIPPMNSLSTQNKILLVEDNAINQKMIQSYFEQLGLSITTANDGQEAIEIAKKWPPDLFLMDMHMPVMNGIDTTLALRKNPAHRTTPIIAISADAFAEQRENAFAAGVTEYLAKPVDFEKLTVMLNKYLQKKSDHDIIGTTQGAVPAAASVAKIREEMIVLAKIPPYLANKITLQINRIRDLCGPNDNRYHTLLNQIEELAYSENVDEISSLLDEVLHA